MHTGSDTGSVLSDHIDIALLGLHFKNDIDRISRPIFCWIRRPKCSLVRLPFRSIQLDKTSSSSKNHGNVYCCAQ